MKKNQLQNVIVSNRNFKAKYLAVGYMYVVRLVCIKLYLSHVILEICNQVRLKLAHSATKANKSLRISDIETISAGRFVEIWAAVCILE